MFHVLQTSRAGGWGGGGDRISKYQIIHNILLFFGFCGLMYNGSNETRGV